MNAMGIGLIVALGTAIGVHINYPHAAASALLVLGVLNGGFALLATVVAASALRLFGVLPPGQE